MVGEYEAVVYDLDGTLVELDVDWEAAARDAAAVLRARGVDVEELTLWEMLETATDRGLKPPVSGALAEHEREGAKHAAHLPLADELPRPERIGVCSLNAESACRIALQLHGLDAYVDAVVGRDSVDSYKPDPEPLLHTLALLDVDPSEALFVGDTDRDQAAARGAGVDFQWARDRR